jgi:hypothetical protein
MNDNDKNSLFKADKRKKIDCVAASELPQHMEMALSGSNTE